jgi:hypothetical protein
MIFCAPIVYGAESVANPLQDDILSAWPYRPPEEVKSLSPVLQNPVG